MLRFLAPASRVEKQTSHCVAAPALRTDLRYAYRKEVRVTTVNQRGVIRLAALNRAAKVIDQRFAHQVFRKIAPRLRSIVGTDSGQNTQPRFVARRLQIAEPAARMYRLCFDVNVAAIKLKAVLILQPTKRRDAVFNFSGARKTVS